MLRCRARQGDPGAKMFVGHYGVSFAAKSVEMTLPLWLLCVTVQIVDVFWAIFVLLGVENVMTDAAISSRTGHTPSPNLSALRASC